MPGDYLLVIDDSPTILKVVQLVLTKAGYRVQVAADGEEGIRLATGEAPRLILLDFVMPKMNGYQVCRALSDQAALKDVPIVLMSAKGDQVGERFVKVMGIVDYITKPFSPEAITAVVQHTMAKYPVARPPGGADPDGASGAPEEAEGGSASGDEPGTARVVPDGAWAGAQGPHTIDPFVGSSERPTPSPDAFLVQSRRRAVSPAQFARRLDALASFREALAEHFADEPGGRELADRLRERLDDITLDRLLAPTVRTLFESDPSLALRGNLQQVPIAEVLGLLKQQQQWGVLTVTRPGDANGGGGEPRVRVHFKQGRIDLCSAENLGDHLGDETRVGRYLVEEEAVTRADLELLLESRSPSSTTPIPIGRQLVRLNYCGETAVRMALRRQAAERIYEVLRWPAGHFEFAATREIDPMALDAALQLDVDAVLMEGFRRIDEWHLIEREIDDFDAVYLRNEEAVQNLGKARLTREELTILETVSGKNTVKDIVRLTRMSSFDVSKMLFRLLSIKLIRRRVAPVLV